MQPLYMEAHAFVSLQVLPVTVSNLSVFITYSSGKVLKLIGLTCCSGSDEHKDKDLHLQPPPEKQPQSAGCP